MKIVESRPDLGPQLAIYRNASWHIRLLFTVFLPGVLFVLAPLTYGVFRYNFDYTHYGPAAVQRWVNTWSLISLAGFFMYLLVLILGFPKTVQSLTLYQNGLYLAFPTRKSLCWDQIKGISSEIVLEKFFGIPVKVRQHATLYPLGGKPLRLDGLDQLQELVTQIKAHLYPHLIPNLEKQFDSGEWLHFGPVSVRSDAFLLKGQQAPWSRIRSLSIQSGDLVVEFGNRNFVRQPAGSILNLELLFRMVQKVIV